jgi:disulfide bond formation protein DsbB
MRTLAPFQRAPRRLRRHLLPSPIMGNLIKPPQLHAALGVASLALVAIAVYYLQETVGLLPCPLCVVQRIAYLLIGATALIAAVLRPHGLGRWIFGGLLLVWSSAGAAVAGWQVWLTYHPHVAECGISPEERFLNALPLARWWPAFFEANGDCTSVTWKFLGLSVPELSLLAFLGLAVAAVWAARREG